MIEVSRKELLDRLEVAARIAARKSPKEVLLCVKLSSDGKTLTMTANDSEVGVRLAVPCTGKPCELLLPAAHTVAVLRAFNTDPLKIIPEETGALFQGQGESCRVKAPPVAEFPEWKHDRNDPIQLNGGAFRKALDRAAFAADSTNSLHYAMGGVCLRLGNGEARVESTDSRVLAVESFHCEAPKWEGVIPVKAVSALMTLGGDVTATVTNNGTEFTDGHTVVWSRLVEGRFPQTDAIFKGIKPEAEIDVTVGELLRVTKLASITVVEESRGATYEIKSATLLVNTSDSDKGSAALEIPVACDKECGTTIDVFLMLKMLNVLDPLDVVHWAMAANTANLFQIGNWRGVVMPLARD